MMRYYRISRFIFRAFFGVVLCGFLGAGAAHAAAGASFLKLGVGARALGLGSAYTAIANDATALHWNPAGLSALKQREVSAMHAELYADTRYDFIGYAHPTRFLNMGISAVYLTQGSIEGRTLHRAKSQDFTANDLLVSLGGSKMIFSEASVGGNVKLIQSKIADASSRGFALDLGATVKPAAFMGFGGLSRMKGLTLGFAVQNLGPKMRFAEEEFHLPLTAAIGLGYQPVPFLLFSADAKRQIYDSKTLLSAGAEFKPLSFFSMRAGYLTGAGNRSDILERSNFKDQLGGLAGLGLGFGVKLGRGTLDYSFTPAGELGSAQRISLAVRF